MNFRHILRRVVRYLRFIRALVLEQIPEKAGVVLKAIFRMTLRVAAFLIPFLVTMSLIIILYTVGFEDVSLQHEIAYLAHHYILLAVSILVIVRFLIMLPQLERWRARLFNVFLIILVLYLKRLTDEISLLQSGSSELLTRKFLLFAGIIVLFFTEVSYILRFIYRRGVNPALLFVGSFATLIIIGGFLLLLPNATTSALHPVDAFFTSASAVCVTGLIVVDTATVFTITGKVIILMLIQLGGLGIMTFAGLIGFMVTGSVSIQNQIALKDMMSGNRMSNVISFIATVVIVTLTFEAIGALMIYSSLPEGMFGTKSERIFFSVFHAISAFCNAGFSTLTDGLYDGLVRFNYGLHWAIAILIILGGIGFPVLFNIFTFLRIKISNSFKRLLNEPQSETYTNILQATAKLSLTTYFFLLLVGFAAFFVFEYNATLHEHTKLFGKITVSFFGSVAPRTAGFNTVDINMLSLPDRKSVV